MKQSTDRSSLFLVELIIDLLLFALCAAVCVALLVHARSMGAESRRLTEAVYDAQDVAEYWKANGTIPTQPIPDEDDLIGPYDEQEFTLIRFDIRDNVLDITITASDGTVVYTLKGVTHLE